MKTFERMHESRTKEIGEWADLGRKIRQTPVVPSGTSVQPVVAPAPAPVHSLQPIDVKSLVEKYGNQELVEALAGPVNAAIAAVSPLMQRAADNERASKEAAQETLGKTVQDFFTAPEMKPFNTVYGTSIAKLTAGQVEMRGKVLETADALIAGAAFQGRRLSVNEALTLAHDTVSSGTKENVIREKIRTDVTRRERQITMKPTAIGRRAAGGPPRDRAELVGRTSDRLAAVFG
jgi:hypothetical protein